MITGVDRSPRTERAVMMVMVPCVAVMPVPVMCPAVVYVPPIRVIAPVPRTVPCYPTRTPEPIVYNRSVNIYRLDDIVRSVYVLIAYDLHFHIVLRFVFLYVYRGHVLIDILREDSLQHYQTFATFTRLNYAQVIHLAVSVEIEVTERTVGIVEHRLELLQVLSLCEQFSYNLQIESFRDVRTVGRHRHCFVRP
jgi:hypothetical protein